MFGFFGKDKKKDQSSAPQPQRIDERSNYGSPGDSIDEIGNRRACIARSFGTNNLDKVLERYAPDHSDALKMIPVAKANQQIIYDKLKEQDKKIEAQDKKIDEQNKKIDEQTVLLKDLKDSLQKQEELTARLASNLDFVSGVLGEIYEAVLKKQISKEPENKTPQK